MEAINEPIAIANVVSKSTLYYQAYRERIGKEKVNAYMREYISQDHIKTWKKEYNRKYYQRKKEERLARDLATLTI